MPSVAYRANYPLSGFDVIVVGSGIGGLAAAALLAQHGKKVLVLERHTVAGGFTHSFKRKKFEWDVGLHYVGEVHHESSLLSQFFKLITNNQLEWAPMPTVYDRALFGDPAEEYHFITGQNNLIEELKSHFPNETQAIDRYFELIRECTRSVAPFFALKAMPQVIDQVAGNWLARDFQRYASQTTLEVLSKITSNQKLIGVLTTQYGDYGMTPAYSSFAMHAMLVKHYLKGGSYPVGGAGIIAEKIIPLIEQAGGRVVTRADVSQVLIKKGRAYGVVLADGTSIEAPVVISNTGVVNTFTRLLPSEYKSKIDLFKKLSKVQPSLAHVGLYLGISKSDAEMGFTGTNDWIFPDYDHDKNLKDYFNDPTAPLPVTYISFPSSKDPSYAAKHPNQSTVEIVGVAPYERFRKWEDTAWYKRGEEYNQFKKELGERYLKVMDRFWPKVRENIAVCEVSTPLSTRHFSNYAEGEIYGLDHTPERFKQKWLRPSTPIKGLYLTGQDIVTVGIGGALMGGVLTASVLLKKNLIKEVMGKR